MKIGIGSDHAGYDLKVAASGLRGRAAVANAHLAYQTFEKTLAGARWERLVAAGARAQRPPWASTGVKSAASPDALYVTELVAPGVVNTMPDATHLATADHGVIAAARLAVGPPS